MLVKLEFNFINLIVMACLLKLAALGVMGNDNGETFKKKYTAGDQIWDKLSEKTDYENHKHPAKSDIKGNMP
jgi:hypothetical protein